MPLTVNDTAPALTGTLTYVPAGSTTALPVSIVGATLAVRVKRPDGTLINRAGTIVDGPNGSWSMTWQSGDLTLAGNYTVELQVTYSGGTIQTFARDAYGDVDTFAVRDEFA